VDPASAAVALDVIEAAFRSARAGQTVEVTADA
jgi:hypothetical protein